MDSGLKKIAQGLFIKLGDSINKAAGGLPWMDWGRHKFHLLRLSTDEHYQEDEPQKDIFYVKLYFCDEEFPIVAGIGSLTRNQILLNIDIVQKGLCGILHDRFFFSVIAVHGKTFEVSKEDCLRAWRRV